MRKPIKWAIILAIMLSAIAGPWAIYAHRYPYGWSHCCDKIIQFALQVYADSHDGWYPRGEATPEASLSLLYKEVSYPIYAQQLRGKTVPLEVTQAQLDTGGLLTPETCGWHYVEGLRKDDSPKLALFWDKVGLGHNGERLEEGGHNVCFVGMQSNYIPGDKWEQFLTEQDRLRAQIKR